MKWVAFIHSVWFYWPLLDNFTFIKLKFEVIISIQENLAWTYAVYNNNYYYLSVYYTFEIT